MGVEQEGAGAAGVPEPAGRSAVAAGDGLLPAGLPGDSHVASCRMGKV